MTRVASAVLALAGTLVALALGVGAADAAGTVWLCNPEASSSPCRVDLTSTKLSPTNQVLGIERAPLARRSQIDCFYVYPTVSADPGPQADLSIDPEERAIARFQASRYSQTCRVWAPMYRQITLAGLGAPATVTPAMRATAYADVRAAFRTFLQRRDRGAGFVLIGHSQGTFVLRQLIHDEVDAKPAVRRRLVSALLLGGDVTVAKGRQVGGDFRHVPGCRSVRQLGCVVAYSTFDTPVPADTRFGRPRDRATTEQVTDPGLAVLCTNPAALGGGAGQLRTYVPVSPFPGALGLAVNAQLGALPKVTTPWITYPSTYSARCSAANGAHVLQVTTAPGGRVLPPSPDATWGLHLTDASLPLGNLTQVVAQQSTAYLGRLAAAG